LSESGTRFYSDSEINSLIDDISEIAKEAIETAAGEAARAAMLAGLEREALLLQAEALALREASLRQAEALRWRNEAETIKRNGKKRALSTGLICLLGGLTIGMTGGLLLGGK
jgi:hypothetical protein